MPCLERGNIGGRRMKSLKSFVFEQSMPAMIWWIENIWGCQSANHSLWVARRSKVSEFARSLHCRDLENSRTMHFSPFVVLILVLCVLGRKTMISVIKDNPYFLIINMAMVYMIVSSEITLYWLLWWPGDKMYGTLLISFGKGGNLNAKNGMGKRAWHGLQNVNMQNAK